MDKINQDREKFNLTAVKLSSNQAAQVHAEDLLRTRELSHWMTNGEKPYMTYTRNDGLGGVQRSAAYIGNSENYYQCISGEYTCDPLDLYNEIDQHELALVYDKEICCSNSDRNNVLDRHYTDVSIGIAYDNYTFTLVHNIEKNYIRFDKPITSDNKIVDISGNLRS